LILDKYNPLGIVDYYYYYYYNLKCTDYSDAVKNTLQGHYTQSE